MTSKFQVLYLYILIYLFHITALKEIDRYPSDFHVADKETHKDHLVVVVGGGVSG